MIATDEQHAAEPTITNRWFPLRHHPVQSAAWRTSARFVTLPCGRMSGKSELAKRRLVRFLPVDLGWPVTRYRFIAPTGPQAKEIAWNDLKNLTPRSWLLGLPRETDMLIRCQFASHIAELRVIGMDRPQRAEGSPLDGVVSDESSDQKSNLELSVRPALDARNGWWWQIGIPKRQGIGARKYRENCERGMAGEAGWANYAWPSWDILPAEVIEAARHDMDAKDFNEQYGAVWESIGGAAFHEFDERVHVRQVLYDPMRPILVGADFNVDPMAWVLGQTTPDGKELQIFDEIWLRDTNTIKTLDVLWGRYGSQHKGGWVFHGDASGHSRQTSASYSDYAHVISDARYKAKTLWPTSHPAIKDRLSSCNAMFRNAAGAVRLHIDPRCINLIDDLRNRGLDRNGLLINADKDSGGHATDALGYLIHYRWPSTRLEPRGSAPIGIFHGSD